MGNLKDPQVMSSLSKSSALDLFSCGGGRKTRVFPVKLSKSDPSGEEAVADIQSEDGGQHLMVIV